MRVRLLFFAVLREIAGVDERELSLAQGATARQVWDLLCREYPALAGYTQPPMVAVNESYADPDTVLQDRDEVAFIPPVAGG